MSSKKSPIKRVDPSVLLASAAPELPADQQRALEMLLSGKSMAATARDVGISRPTLYSWLKNDPAFMAAYNRWHDEIQHSARSRMLTMLQKAADTVEKKLEDDPKLAFRLLEKMGAVKNHPVGPTNLQDLQHDKQKADQKRLIDDIYSFPKLMQTPAQVEEYEDEEEEEEEEDEEANE